jgi:hypothetical protein
LQTYITYSRDVMMAAIGDGVAFRILVRRREGVFL